MKTIAISLREFEAIANRDESHFFDQKSKSIDGRGIQKIAVALANVPSPTFATDFP